MEIKRLGTQASIKGSKDWFTGTVRIDPLNAAPAPSKVSCAAVTFEPGARTAWHTRPSLRRARPLCDHQGSPSDIVDRLKVHLG